MTLQDQKQRKIVTETSKDKRYKGRYGYRQFREAMERLLLRKTKKRNNDDREL